MTAREIRELPDDPGRLKDLLIEECQRSALLQHRLSLLLRHKYGTSSEKRSLGQGRLDFGYETEAEEREDLPDPDAERAEPQEKKRKRGGRKPLPPHWPRERREHDIAEEDKTCSICHGALKKIGEEVSEEVEVIPARYKVIEHVRPKYACPCCQQGVRIAELPDRMIEKGRPGAGLIAQVIANKFAWHLPYYRQAEMLAGEGWDISRAVLTAWAGVGAERLRPIVQFMRDDVLNSAKLHTDDTPVRVLDPGRGKTREARFWVYVGHGQHAHVVFDYTPRRKRDGPAAFLGEYEGYLQADAFAGYDAIYAGRKIIEVACWAHARRKFIEAEPTDRQHVGEILELIGKLYEVEDLGRGRPPQLRYELRQLKSAPLLQRIGNWLELQEHEALPKSPLGQAVRYARNNWPALNRFLEEGILEPDNNNAENALRCVALGRKNWLFVGNDDAGRRAAILYSLVASCRTLGVDPFMYLRDALVRVNSHPARLVHELAPLNWKQVFLPALTQSADQKTMAAV